MGLGFGWSSLTGLMQDVDATTVGIWSFTLLVPGFALYWLRRATQRSAASLGHVELDELGARWLRLDGTLGFNVPWLEVDHATFDLRNSTLVLFRRDGGAGAILGVLDERGYPSGLVVLERFDELVAVVSAKVPTSDHRAVTNRSAAKENARVQLAARRALRLGALCCVTAAGVYAANVALHHHLHWDRWLLPVPLFIGGMGVLTVVAGFRLRAGDGPQISPIYSPSFRGIMIRFLVVAPLANFVLLGVANMPG